ncbi:UTRA domain-containing protein [Sphingomonas sp. CL5.1]|uniref:UTRA domain-containing protein n=1 Tax=Sphingomonas sp. CL5.1 TaxID=2653203 RepID=UPI001582CCFF|nr:UTRA domain-containing protein [Sphingomonas sp. CL5.1]QKR98753.1 UTRA domain-containing protein [Sphingomonas sp. CL5.1]
MTSLHARIVGEIEADILSGALAAGARLPVEQELMRRYDCSRMTVSKALGELTRRGLIDRRKRAGTFVGRPRVHSVVLDIPDLAQEVAARGQAYAYCLAERRIRAASDAERALAGAGKVLQLDGVHLADGLPLAVEERLVSLASVPEAADALFEDVSPGGWLLHHVPWTEAETRIAADGASGVIAERLGVAAGTPCLVIERTTWRGDAGVTFVRQHFLGAHYDLVARFGPGAR